ncbi:hypothetical protein [Streptomyces lincolnensis]|uniref:hypothetical protein n=1 Tax=Streptomyces lincolnensis TaxID=1915 RepID=UPI0037D01A2E
MPVSLRSPRPPRAAQVKEFGGLDVLVPVDLPDPVPGPGEVLIDVAHPGGSVSGTVTALGAGVPQEWLDRRVAFFVQRSYASRVVAGTDAVTVVPDGLDLLSAAALAFPLSQGPGEVRVRGSADGETE